MDPLIFGLIVWNDNAALYIDLSSRLLSLNVCCLLLLLTIYAVLQLCLLPE